MEALSTKIAKLVPLTTIPYKPMYEIQKLPGAMEHPLLAEKVIEQLSIARNFLQSHYKHLGQIDFLIWDAFRRRETQNALFNNYVKILKDQHPHLPEEEIRFLALRFVSPPKEVYPHGTGGAVDITLTINGIEVWMGSSFDDFRGVSKSNYFDKNQPKNCQDKEAQIHRQILKRAMEAAGFVGIPSEWWHYEYGTKRWAQETGNQLFLNGVLTPPTINTPALPRELDRIFFPTLHEGVAHIFPTQRARAESLSAKQRGHYYGRASHPTNDQLTCYYQHLFNAETVELFSSGLSACIGALEATMPKGGTLIYDSHIYYETYQAITKYLAPLNNWSLKNIDLIQPQNLYEFFDKADVVYMDNPQNWFLNTFDINNLVSIAHDCGTLLIVDASVQPLQKALEAGADLVVISLSKYPSTGLTFGGVVMGPRHLLGKVHYSRTKRGDVLAPQAAFTILQQSQTLQDRLNGLDVKARRLAEFLKSRQDVSHVRIPNPEFLNNLTGGQVTFHLKDGREAGWKTEVTVAAQFYNPTFTLHLGCTFGTITTTFEHFASNKRYRPDIKYEESNESLIPDDLIRIGIGCEPIEKIIQDLDIVLNMTTKASVSVSVSYPCKQYKPPLIKKLKTIKKVKEPKRRMGFRR